MSQVDEAVLDLTVSEASLLADVLGVAPPPGLVDPDDDVTDAASAGATVAPGLVERRILDAEGTVAAPVAELLTVVGSPHLVARAVHEVGGRSEIRSFAVRPEMAVEQRGMANRLVRFTPFHPKELVDRIMAFVADGHPLGGDAVDSDLVESGGPSFECPSEIIDRVFAVAASDRAATLIDVGVDPETAAIFAAAVENLQSTNSVTVLHRPAEQEIIGVDLTWMDSGRHGLWLTEPSESEPGHRLIERLTAADLAGKLTNFLPFG